MAGSRSKSHRSVWSHVLLIDHVDLAAVDRLSWLLGLFRRPGPSAHHDRYETPLIGGSQPAEPRPLHGPVHLATLAGAVYGRTEDAVVQLERSSDLEAALMALWEQQWPRLRRSFSFRTRHRATGSKSVRFDLQVGGAT